MTPFRVAALFCTTSVSICIHAHTQTDAYSQAQQQVIVIQPKPPHTSSRGSEPQFGVTVGVKCGTVGFPG